MRLRPEDLSREVVESLLGRVELMVLVLSKWRSDGARGGSARQERRQEEPPPPFLLLLPPPSPLPLPLVCHVQVPKQQFG